MNGNDNAVLDSNFLIYISKGIISRSLLESRYDRLFASIITYIEVYAYEFDDPTEKHELDEVFDYLEIISVDKSIADLCIDYRKNKIKKIKLPDAVIFSHCKSHQSRPHHKQL